MTDRKQAERAVQTLKNWVHSDRIAVDPWQRDLVDVLDFLVNRETPSPFVGDDFLKWLRDQGLITDSVRRVVIDAKVNEAVKMYVEQFGSRRMIEVSVPTNIFDAIKIEV